MMRLTITEEAQAQIDTLREWLLAEVGFFAAERLTDTFEEEIRAMLMADAEDLGRNLYRDAKASDAFDFSVYLRYFSTAKKRTRRSASGLYRLFYRFREPDLVEVFGIWHGAALLPWDDAPTAEG